MIKIGKTEQIISLVFGLILVFYLVASTFNDSADEIEGIPDTTNVTGTPQDVKGVNLVKLLPLFLSLGVLVMVWRRIKSENGNGS